MLKYLLVGKFYASDFMGRIPRQFVSDRCTATLQVSLVACEFLFRLHLVYTSLYILPFDYFIAYSTAALMCLP